MVEGLVMELYKDHVIVMTKSGEFLKLKKRGSVNVGDIYKENIYRKIPLFVYAAAAALIFVVTSFAGYTAYANQIVGYVDIKGDKDVRLYVSRNGTVEKVDGVQNSTQIKNLPVEKAVKELNTIAPGEGIYNKNSEVEVSTTKVKESKLDLNKVNDKVKKIISKDNKSLEKKADNPSNENKVNSNKNNNHNKNKKDEGNINNNQKVEEINKNDKKDNNVNNKKDKKPNNNRDKDKNKDKNTENNSKNGNK